MLSISLDWFPLKLELRYRFLPRVHESSFGLSKTMSFHYLK
jgi:hypothetical protein